MNRDTVRCEICGEEFKQISNTHLNCKHNISFEEYGTKCPNACLNTWNKGLTKKTDKRIARATRKITRIIRKQYENGRVGSNKGRKFSKEWRKRLSDANKGRIVKFTKEHLKNLGIANRKNAQDPVRNQKISEAMKGRKVTWINKIITPERNAKISKALEGRDSYWMKGDKNVAKRPEVREKISNAMKARKITWREKLSESIREGYRNGRTTWIKGLTKETDERIARYAKGLIGHILFYPKLYYVPELGHKVRSSYEKEVGLILKKAGIPYDYEDKVYKFDGTSYRPDFPITDKLLVEAKGYFADRQREKYKKFREAYPEITLIIVGGVKGEDLSEYCNIHIPWEDREKLVEGILREP